MRSHLTALLFVLFAASPAIAADQVPAAIHQPTVQAPHVPVVPGAPAAAVQTPLPSITVPAPADRHGKPAKLTSVQQARVNARVPVVKKSLADLSVDEQRAVLRKAAPPRQKLTDAERAARAKGARDAWAAKSQQDRAELRARYLAAWQKLPPADRTYRRERMQEQLRALPEEDRKQVIAPFITSNVPAK